MRNPIRQAEDALDQGTDAREVLHRHGMEAAHQRRLGELRNLLYSYAGPDGDRALGTWTADLVDAGHLEPRDGS